MKILAGHFKNHPLKTPKGSKTRPTTSKIRESLFNILQHQIENARFLDLFAGSGACGLEAISRGAKEVTFVEKDKGALACLRENIKTLQVNPTVMGCDVKIALKKLANEKALFDIIFADPPYELDITFLPPLLAPLLADEGVVIIEQSKHSAFKPEGLQVFDQRIFGDTTLFFLNKN